MIHLDQYSLTADEHIAISQQLADVGGNLTLSHLWALMDQAWVCHACNNLSLNSERLAKFYSDPVWLLNGIFSEQDSTSLGHRQAISAFIAAMAPERVLDFGGGFGTLARLLAAAMPQAEISICDPFPPRLGLERCQAFSNINYVSELQSQSVDVLVSTDVLEHVPDPLTLLASMVDAVRPGGHLLIANCFYPVIACHLPCTFHLRYSFDSFCKALGLAVIGSCYGSHATVYRRVHQVQPDWRRLRKMEMRSQRLFPWRERYRRHLRHHLYPWMVRSRLAISNPLHYPQKALDRLFAR